MATVVRMTRKEAEWERAAPRKIPKARWQQLEQYAAEIFQTMGMRLDSAGTRETPRRFIRALFDASEGYVINALDRILAAHGVAVYLDAAHLCMQMRGVREQEATTRTTFWRGAYESDEQLRNEFLKLCQTGDDHQ